MSAARGFSVAIRFERAMLPEGLIDYARRSEKAGFDEFWVVEDLTFNGGISAAATVLASTQRMRVGIGIMPAVARNPAYLSMELATLARIHPGRLVPGIGHGVADWMRQVGALPASQLAALEETSLAIRRLLRGENLTMHGKHVHIESVKLLLPPDEVPPLSLGVRAIKSLELAGRSGDGTILTEGASPTYVRWARAQIDRGRSEAGRTEPHRVTVFAYSNVDSDSNAAYARLRPLLAADLAAGGLDVLVEPLGILPQIRAWLAEGGVERLKAVIPDAWMDQIAIVGTPEQCAAAVHRLADAGADTIVLMPTFGQGVSELTRILQAV